jgi:hypothetical protein
MSFIVAAVPEGFNIHNGDSLFWSGPGKTVKDLESSIKRIKILKTEEEKINKRRAYRRDYSKRPLVQAKQKEKQKDPDRIKKRTDYAAKPEVKLRKHFLGKRQRAITKALKYERPDIYGDLLKQVQNDPSFQSEGDPGYMVTCNYCKLPFIHPSFGICQDICPRCELNREEILE